MKKITGTEIVLFVFLGILSWLLSFILLGWLGNLIVTFWAKSRGLKMKNPSRDLLLHLCSPLMGLFPLIPASLAQFFILYAEQSITQITSQPTAKGAPPITTNTV